MRDKREALNVYRKCFLAAVMLVVAAASAPAQQAPKPISGDECAVRPGDTFRDCDGCPEMVVIPPGTFTMGSPTSEVGRYDDEGPQHQVTISRPFAVGKFTVSVDEFSRFVKATGYSTGPTCYSRLSGSWENKRGISWKNPDFKQGPKHPAMCLSWDDSKSYVRWLSETTSKAYRLPTEAEWEYAVRANSTTRYFFGRDEKKFCRYGNVADRAAKKRFPRWTVLACNDGSVFTAPAGTYQPNAFGLYDMVGNAWQWLEDCWNPSYAHAPSDGSADLSGECSRHIVRGGSWDSDESMVRSANRRRNFPTLRNFDDGFRVARSLQCGG
jgi:formylglycine-generating enzyme required for sulfatase activity